LNANINFTFQADNGFRCSFVPPNAAFTHADLTTTGSKRKACITVFSCCQGHAIEFM